MDYFDENSKVLQKVRAGLYEKLSALPFFTGSEDAGKFLLLQTRDELSAMVITDAQNNQVRINSAYHPLAEAEQFAKRQNYRNLQNIIEMFGFGNGIICRAIMKNMNAEDKLIVYEPDAESFCFVLHHYDLRDFLRDERFYFCIHAINEEYLDDTLMRQVSWYNMESQFYICHPFYDRLYPDQYKWFLLRLKASSERAIISNNTDAALGKHAIENIARNMRYLPESNLVTDIMTAIPPNTSAIIVAAGPSLQKNIEQLKLAKGHAVIFAVDTCIKYLEKYGVEPDFVVTIDPRKSEKHFNNALACRTPLIAKLEAKPEILAKHTGRKLFYSSHTFLETLYRILGITIEDYTSGGSVATAAFSVCIAMGFRTIIFVGQDLAFDGEVTHMGGRIQKEEKFDLGIKMVEGIDGKLVKTRYDWAIYLDWFNGAIANHPELTFIDATEGGAKIQGTVILPLAETITRYCTGTVDIHSILEQTPSTMDEAKRNAFYTLLKQAKEDIGKIRQSVKECSRSIDKMLELHMSHRLRDKDSAYYVAKIRSVSEQIEKLPVQALYETYMAQYSRGQMRDIYKMGEDAYENAKKTYQQAQLFYQEELSVSDEIEELVEKMIIAFHGGSETA